MVAAPSVAIVPSPLMPAAVYVGNGRLAVEQVPCPEPGPAKFSSRSPSAASAARICIWSSSVTPHRELFSATNGRASWPLRAQWLRLVSGRPGGGKHGSGVWRLPTLSAGPPFGVPEPGYGRLRRVPRCLLPVQNGGGRRPDPDSRFSPDQSGCTRRTDGHHPACVAVSRRGSGRSGPCHRGRTGRPPAGGRAAGTGDLRHHRE